MAIRTILFDNDGTLVDTYDMILASFRHATQKVLGRQFSEAEYMAKVGQPLATQMWDFTNDPKVHQDLLASYRAHNESTHDQLVKAFPGIVDQLSALKAAGFSMGVVTSKMHALAWHGLQVVCAAPYMDCLVGADDCEKHKPDPAPILLGCQRMGAAPAECIYVGDSPFDIAAGNAAGCKTLAVTWGMFDEAELLAENPSAVVRLVGELVETIQGLK